MAISKTLKLKDNFGFDVTFQDAYIKVSNINGTKEMLHAHVCIYDKKDGMQIDSKAFDLCLWRERTSLLKRMIA